VFHRQRIPADATDGLVDRITMVWQVEMYCLS
jgi:hypothetical protein